MITCPHHPHSPCLLLPRSTAAAAPASSLRRCRNPLPTAAAAATPGFTDPAGAAKTLDILRRHNAKSTALLLRHTSPQTLSRSPEQEPRLREEERDLIPEEERVRISELSLVANRSPRFPGSISPGDYGYDAGVASSPPPLHKLFRGEGGGDDEEMLLRALEIRRGVTAEILKDAIQNGKFGLTYSTNLVSKLPDFIDHIMVEAASMRRSPEFSHSPYHFRAKTAIHNSNVVPLIRWLKHHQLSFPQIGKLICLSAGSLDTIPRVLEWLKSNHVKGRFIGVALMKAGENILNRRIEDLDEMVGYLESRGVKRDWMGYVISRCPQLLSYTMEEMRTRVKFYLDMGMNDKDFGTMVYDYPKALGYLTLEEMNQKVNYLKEFGLVDKDLGWLLALKPQLMGCSIEGRWKPLIKYLYYLGIDRGGMRRILVKKPVVFCIDMETVVVPKVRFLKDIGVREDAIGIMLVKFPPLLTYSLYNKIRPVVIFLITKAGVSQKNVGKVVALEPELLGCSIAHKLEVSVKYFLSLGIPLRQLGEMIGDFPGLLRYNVDPLHPKYRYLRRTMIRPLQDLIKFPRFFSYSLEDRIIPRHKILVENRINFELHYMLASTDEEFDQRVQAAVEGRRRFESGFTDGVLSDSQTAANSAEKRAFTDCLDSGTCSPSPQPTICSTETTQLSSSTGEDSQSCFQGELEGFSSSL